MAVFAAPPNVPPRWLKAGAVLVAIAVGAAAWHQFNVFRGDQMMTAERSGSVRRHELEQCAEAALLIHDVRWAASCMILAEQDEKKHAACSKDPAIMGNPQLGQDYCDRTFPHRDGSAECTLPDERAASLHAILRDADRRCVAEGRVSP